MLRIRTFFVLTALLSSLVVAVGMSAKTEAQQPLAPGLSALTPVGPFLLSFNENGQATIAVNGGPTTPLTGTLMADPTNPAVGSVPVLTYLLPEPVITGDVSFAEPGGGISDWLRFTDAAGTFSGAATGAGPRMIFYSEFELGELNRELADTGFPANLGTGNVLAMLEVGPEGANGFDYRPGGVPYPANNEYVGISDRVPEPSSLVLFGSGLAALGLIVRRRRQLSDI